MTVLSFQVSPDVEKKIADMANESGKTVDDLLGEMTARMVRDFEARQTFETMAGRGHGEIDQALELLVKADPTS
jgi:predicted transcriptional regulator